MGSTRRRSSDDAFAALRDQVTTAALICTDDQLLELADSLHEALRRRRTQRYGRGDEDVGFTQLISP